MRLGAIFPQTEIGADPDGVIAFAQAAEAAGYAHIEAYDHVLGADPAWRSVNGPYTHEAMFHEPFVLYSHLAAVTTTLEFSTGVLVLPQRQTALVAKQAAALQVLSRGRLRLGVGLGWNEREYEALNQDYHTRGRRIEEQITLLRRLWTEPVFSFHGRDHTLNEVGLNPLPTTPIPIWMGGGVGANQERVLNRIGRLADGWMIERATFEELPPQLEQVHAAVESSGRDLSTFGVALRGVIGRRDLDEEVADAIAWRETGYLTHYTVNSMGAGLTTPADHIRVIEAFMERYQAAG